jgi:hypothetical protein
MQTHKDPQAIPANPFRRFHPKGALFVWGALFFLLAAFGAGWHGHAAASSMLYKDYIIRYDRGWDILCEPYVVQKNDWVLKIFRQKGEIAHHDFRDFQGIFQRLNPHIKNVDMIRPGQTIDIPLRKLEHGTLPGQGSGVVTIPFVTLAKVVDVVQQHSQTYQVQRGDTVSHLLARKYGRYGSKSYREGVKLFQAANTEVTDLNRIYAGQTIHLPDPAIRDEAWYASLYDDQGNLRQTLDRGTISPPGPLSSTQATAEAPERAPQNSPLEQAAAVMGGQLASKGTYYLPRQGSNDFELDLSRHPMLEVPGQGKRVFTRQPRVMEMETAAFESTWPDIKVVTYDDHASVTEIVTAIFDTLEAQPETEGAELGFDDQAVHVAVRAKWVRPQNDQRHLCITPIKGPDEQTPDSIRRYLEQNGITIKELLASGEAAATAGPEAGGRHAVKNVLAIAATSQKEFVKSLARTLNLAYTPNISITFPYAGIQVQAYANLISAEDDRELLVDFGDLYGDAVAALRNTGMEIIQVTAEDSYTAVVKKILSALNKQFVENPTFLAAQRPAQYNTAITIWGVLYNQSADKRILLAGGGLHPAITDLLSASGIDVVEW